MTYENYVQSKSTKELEEELYGLNEAIDEFECFGVRDVWLREHIEVELRRRELLDEYIAEKDYENGLY